MLNPRLDIRQVRSTAIFSHSLASFRLLVSTSFIPLSSRARITTHTLWASASLRVSPWGLRRFVASVLIVFLLNDFCAHTTLIPERPSSHHIRMPLLQPRKLGFGQARQESWCWSTRLPCLRSKIPMRSQLYGLSYQHLLHQAHRLTDLATDLSAAVDVYGEWVDAAGMPTTFYARLYQQRLTFYQMPSLRKTTPNLATVAHLEEELDEATERRSRKTTTTNMEMMIIKCFFYAPCNNTNICYVLCSTNPCLALATRYDI